MKSRLSEERLRRHERTGRPLGEAEFVDKLEKTLGRALHPKKREASASLGSKAE